ncbi:MAG: hypothetical protein IT259_10300, partial [Saprospiraceae bacterium]|nr:hypothetical protein [Saprospiraceae bacterium]
MIQQAYILTSLGKAAFREGEKWYLLDIGAPEQVRPWHVFDNNLLTLAPAGLRAVAVADLDELRALLATETTRQEALTLALQLMDESIGDPEIKTEVAELLNEYVGDAAVLRFLENQVLSVAVADTFNPSFAANLCRTLALESLARLYSRLEARTESIATFYSAWLKTAKNHFQDTEKAEAAYNTLRERGLVGAFVQSVAEGDRALWDNTTVDASLALKAAGLASNAVLFKTLKDDLVQYHQVAFEEKTRQEKDESAATDDIAALIEAYLEEFEKKQKKGKSQAYADFDAVQSNVRYTSAAILDCLRDNNIKGARAQLRDLIRQQTSKSAPWHICKSLTNVAGFLLENGVTDFTKTLLEYAKVLNGNDPVVDALNAERLKAEGDLAGAKQEYMRIKAAWPDNVVAQTGYAEILKAEGNLVGAKQEYVRI